MPTTLLVVSNPRNLHPEDDWDLGRAEQIRNLISMYLPEVEWVEEQSPLACVRKILEADPNNLFYRLQLEQILQEQQARRLEKRFTGRLKGPDFSLVFTGCDEGRLNSFTIQIEGDGSPLQAISKICQDYGWAVVDKVTGEFVELDGLFPEERSTP
jgi:hypothetical protein